MLTWEFILLIVANCMVSGRLCPFLFPNDIHLPSLMIHRFPLSVIYGRRCRCCVDRLPTARKV